jgi:hypothetical protein
LLISKSLFYFVFVFLLLNKNLVFYLNFFKNFIIKYKALWLILNENKSNKNFYLKLVREFNCS